MGAYIAGVVDYLFVAGGAFIGGPMWAPWGVVWALGIGVVVFIGGQGITLFLVVVFIFPRYRVDF